MTEGTEGQGKRASALGALGRLDAREARRVRVVRTLFFVGLVAWTSLAVWWATYFYRSVNEVRAATMRVHAVELRLLSDDIATPERFQVAEQKLRSGAYVRVPEEPPPSDWPVLPMYDGTFLTPSQEVRDRLDSSTLRKYVMLAGEGSLLVGLLFVTLVSLYRSLMSEWRLNRQRDSFVHAVTHELKSPLAGLKALLETIRGVPMEGEERAQYVEMGLAELRRLDRLVANILLTSRLDAKAWAPSVASLDAAAAVSKVVERSVIRFRERGGTLVFRTADVPVVRFDAEALETIVENLIDNALKYASGPPHLELTLESAGNSVFVVAQDQGIGFAPEDGPRLFDKFFRSAGGEVRVAKGSGLGLYIGRALARGSGGELSATSEGPGKGATFTLELPVAG